MGGPTSLGRIPRHAPTKLRESSIIAIECDPLTAGLNSQCRKPCVWDQIAASVCFDAKPRENLPVTLARLNDYTMRLTKQDVAEPQYLIQTARLHKNLGVSGDSDHTAEHLRSHAVACFAVNHSIEPRAAIVMGWRIGPEGMHKNVDVRKYHDLSMTSSSSQDRLRSTPGSTPPEALETGNCTCPDRLPLAPARMTAKPSSTREVKVRPSCAARFLACLRSSSFILTVVLIHQSISFLHQYVKPLTFRVTTL